MKRAIAILMAACGWLSAQDQITETLRKGLVEEESRHNLAAAVESYQSVVAQFEQQRASAATALFRLAECYRRAGRPEANPLYLRIVREFGDQTKLAEQSRRALPNKAPVVAAKASPAATGDEKRREYRQALLAEIDIASKVVQAEQTKFQLGTETNDVVMAAVQHKAQLEKELAAFDMGRTPGK